ncbi:hypothetical protein C1I95_33755 [Micromonospora craterilacus]|uniref:Glyoxalase-like domain-containing protein n=1 Tax=Micromonospora craterilacus TaxID=1655439 RepID=A0A2W2CV50_9ACTN|nr:hypothetical protein C1I95_33755 [Micromonospora craterilacus]
MDTTLTLAAITLDCADPLELATFYQRATGFALHPESDDEFAGLTREDGLKLGAAKPEHQPGGDRFRVLTDPAGHPFCLVPPRH